MSKRFAHIHKLTQIRRDIQAFPDSADRILQVAIIRALPPGYHKIYDWIAMGTFSGSVTTAMVMKAWDLNPNHASTLLNELWQFGLLTRTEQIDGRGKAFVYTIAGKPESEAT